MLRRNQIGKEATPRRASGAVCKRGSGVYLWNHFPWIILPVNSARKWARLWKPEDVCAWPSEPVAPVSAVSHAGACPAVFSSKCHATLQRLKQSHQYCLHLNICLSYGDSNRRGPFWIHKTLRNSDLKESNQDWFFRYVATYVSCTTHAQTHTCAHTHMKRMHKQNSNVSFCNTV